MIEGQPSPAGEGVLSVTLPRAKQPALQWQKQKPVVLQEALDENNEAKRGFVKDSDIHRGPLISSFILCYSAQTCSQNYLVLLNCLVDTQNGRKGHFSSMQMGGRGRTEGAAAALPSIHPSAQCAGAGVSLIPFHPHFGERS